MTFAGAVVELPPPPPNEKGLLDGCCWAVAAPKTGVTCGLTTPPKTGAAFAPLSCPPNENDFVVELLDIPPKTGAALETGAAVAVDDPPNGLVADDTNPENAVVAAESLVVVEPVPGEFPPKENIVGILEGTGAGVEVVTTDVPWPPPKANVDFGAESVAADDIGSSAGVGSFDGVIPKANVELRFTDGATEAATEEAGTVPPNVFVVVNDGTVALGLDSELAPKDRTGTGILLGSVNLVASAGCVLPKVTADDVGAVLENENIPGIDDFAASLAVDGRLDDGYAGGVAAAAVTEAVAIGATPDNVGGLVPKLNPAEDVADWIGAIEDGGEDATVAVDLLLNVNIAAVGELNPVFSVDVAVDTTTGVGLTTFSSAVGCAITGCGSIAGLITVGVMPTTIFSLGFSIVEVVVVGAVVDFVSALVTVVA